MPKVVQKKNNVTEWQTWNITGEHSPITQFLTEDGPGQDLSQCSYELSSIDYAKKVQFHSTQLYPVCGSRKINKRFDFTDVVSKIIYVQHAIMLQC